jgi:hypothetical protein
MSFGTIGFSESLIGLMGRFVGSSSSWNRDLQRAIEEFIIELNERGFWH